MTIIRERRKAVLYVTCAEHLLVFREPDYPEVGVQVPGGTIEDHESVAEGAMRELAEETGIEVVIDAGQLVGQATFEYDYGGLRHRHYRTFFHVPVARDVGEVWRRWETNPDGGGRAILFELFWVPLKLRPDLFAELDQFLERIDQ